MPAWQSASIDYLIIFKIFWATSDTPTRFTPLFPHPLSREQTLRGPPRSSLQRKPSSIPFTCPPFPPLSHTASEATSTAPNQSNFFLAPVKSNFFLLLSLFVTCKGTRTHAYPNKCRIPLPASPTSHPAYNIFTVQKGTCQYPTE